VIPTGSTFSVEFDNRNNDNGSYTQLGIPFEQSVCSTTVTCPIPAGTKFQLSVNVPIPSTLSTSYLILVNLMDSDGNYLACAGTIVTPPPPPPPTTPSSSSSSSSTSSSPSSAAVGGPGNGPGGIQDALKLDITL